ncbi:MAG: TetR/AcrR family transcriptional regulator [Bryobacteraceae bacterium]|nr:TetR/AcrR family transcriptional regulator [Bryobacteraceae bacterium]
MITRAALIDAAEEVFLREGFELASVEQITEAAGFSRGAFYSNFKDKDELAFAVIDKRRRDMASVLRKLQRIPDQARRLAAIRDWFSQQCRQTDWIALRLEFSRRAQRNPALERMLAELCRQEIQTCAGPVAQSFSSSGDIPAVSAVALMAACNGLGSMGLRAAPDLDQLCDAAAALVFDRLLAVRVSNLAPAQEGAHS